MVGNHTGGNMSPETIFFTLAFQTFFGVERRFHQLAHNLVPHPPPSAPLLRRFGTVAASHENARNALESGRRTADLSGRGLGGPPSDLAIDNKVDFGGRRGSFASRSTRACQSSRWSRSAARKRRC